MSKDNNKLFINRARTDLDMRKGDETWQEYLDRSAKPLMNYRRELLQSWFDGFVTTEVKRNEIKRNLLSHTQQSLTCFFELYLSQLFKKHGFIVEVEPEGYTNKKKQDNNQPDFLLTVPDGSKILLEATTLQNQLEKSKNHEGKLLVPDARRRLDDLIDYLENHLKSFDFCLIAEIRGYPPNKGLLPKKKILQNLQKQLDNLQYDEVPNEGYTISDTSLVSCIITYIVYHKSPENRGITDSVRPPLRCRYYGSNEFDINEQGFIESINRKAKHYGKPEIAYIIAINIENHLFNIDDIEPLIKKLWQSSHSNYNLKDVSGIFVFSNVEFNNMGCVKAMLWHHPSPYHRISPELFRFYQQIYDAQNDNYQLKKGIALSEILDLDIARLGISNPQTDNDKITNSNIWDNDFFSF